MARKPTLTGRTIAESDGAFKRAVGLLGRGVDARTERRHAVLVDGVPLGDRQREMRKPETAFYEKTYVEANAVAHLAVNLGLDSAGQVNIRRLAEPMPDTELVVDCSTIAFVEQTMVMDQEAHRLTLDVESLNAAVRRYDDQRVQDVLGGGILQIRFGVILLGYYVDGLPIAGLLDEICALTRSVESEVSPFRPGATRFPLLAGMNTFVTYRRGKASTANPVVSLTDHGRTQLFRQSFAEQIRKKRSKAAGYPATCRPLWLLLDVDIHFGFHDFSTIARAIVAEEQPSEYDRVIVQQTYAPLLAIHFASTEVPKVANSLTVTRPIESGLDLVGGRAQLRRVRTPFLCKAPADSLKHVVRHCEPGPAPCQAGR
jgi:hypothetical protein